MKPRNFSAWKLGGTLFVPSTHKHLKAIAEGEKFPMLRSMVIDTEDGIAEADLDSGLHAIQTLLAHLSSPSPYRFIRPRDIRTLETLLQMDGIVKIDGFVLPKFSLENMQTYLSILEETSFLFMPSIEGVELFDADALKSIRNVLLPFRTRIPLIRFGAEDMLKQLGLRRDCTLSLFDMCLPSQVIGSLMGTFKPFGFELSGGVYRCYQNHEGFIEDVARDLQEGLVSKTIIHPDQIALIDRCYQVSLQEYEEARKLLESKEAVFALNGTMAETQTQKKWADHILQRYEAYGIAP